MIHWLSVFSVTGILLQRYYIFPVLSRLVKKLTDTEDTGPVVVFSADRYTLTFFERFIEGCSQIDLSL